MSFEDLLDQACVKAHLPNMARVQLQYALSDETKKMVLQLSPEVLGCVLSTAIDEINLGSVKSIDTFVREYLFTR